MIQAREQKEKRQIARYKALKEALVDELNLISDTDSRYFNQTQSERSQALYTFTQLFLELPDNKSKQLLTSFGIKRTSDVKRFAEYVALKLPNNLPDGLDFQAKNLNEAAVACILAIWVKNWRLELFLTEELWDQMIKSGIFHLLFTAVDSAKIFRLHIFTD